MFVLFPPNETIRDLSSIVSKLATTTAMSKVHIKVASVSYAYDVKRID